MKKFNTLTPFAGRIRVLLLILAMLAVAACSTIRFTYNHGETLLYWWMNTYLDFDSNQGSAVRRDIDRLFLWHRKTQLHDYAQLLAKSQRQLAGSPTEDDLLTAYRDVLQRCEQLLLKTAPELAELARSVKGEQITRLEKKFTSNNETFRRKFLRGDMERKQTVRFEKSMEQLDLWFGGFSGAQEKQLRAASDARPLDNQFWLDERIHRQQHILTLLRKLEHDKPSKAEAQALVEQTIRDIFARFEAPEHKAFYDAYTQSTVALVHRAVQIATPAQKAAAHKRMQGWIDDMNALAADPR